MKAGFVQTPITQTSRFFGTWKEDHHNLGLARGSYGLCEASKRLCRFLTPGNPILTINKSSTWLPSAVLHTSQFHTSFSFAAIFARYWLREWIWRQIGSRDLPLSCALTTTNLADPQSFEHPPIRPTSSRTGRTGIDCSPRPWRSIDPRSHRRGDPWRSDNLEPGRNRLPRNLRTRSRPHLPACPITSH